MKITQDELDLINSDKRPRRMMRLPVTYDGEAMERPCPMRYGSTYQLTAPSGSTVIAVSAEPRREKLGQLTTGNARREGYASRQLARNAFAKRWGPSGSGRLVWVVSFLEVDDEKEAAVLLDTPVYLAKFGDYTTTAGRQAVPGDPELQLGEDDGEAARVMAIAHREEPTREAVERVVADGEKLRESMSTMKARRRAEIIVKEAEKLRQEMAVSGVVRSEAPELPATSHAV